MTAEWKAGNLQDRIKIAGIGSARPLSHDRMIKHQKQSDWLGASAAPQVQARPIPAVFD
jgi:hypothetical protein